jgi:outer membrane protein OmpA-like peptidoglycan-associated protein
VPEVAIVGHTDTLGDAAANVALGLKRASSVQRLLVDAGLDASIVDVTSHGESDPVVKTPNNIAEPRNRRVEIVVR